MSLLRRIACRLAQRSYEDESMDEAGANDPDVEQTIANGTTVRFDRGRWLAEAALDGELFNDDQDELATKLDGAVGTIEELVTTAAFEYYDVKFPSGEVLFGVPEFTLTPIRVKKWKWKGAGLRTASTTWEGIQAKDPQFIVPQIGDTVKHPSGLTGVVTLVTEKSVRVKMPWPIDKDQWRNLNASPIHSTPEVLEIYAGDGFVYDEAPWRIVRNTWKWKGAQLNSAADSGYGVDEALAHWLKQGITSTPEFTWVISGLTQDSAIIKLAIIAWLRQRRRGETEEAFRKFLSYIAAGDIGRLSVLGHGAEPDNWRWKGARVRYPTGTQAVFQASDLEGMYRYDGQVCTVMAHHGHPLPRRQPQPDLAYYDIQFPDGAMLTYISERSLKPLNPWRWKGPPDNAPQDNS